MKEKVFKYLKTIILCILIMNFITSFISFGNKINDYLTPARIDKNPINQEILSNAESLQKSVTDLIAELRTVYGKDYPALGIIFYKTTLHYSSELIVQNFLFSIISGFGLGNLIYFIFLAKYNKYKLYIAVLLSLIITSLFFSLSDILINLANNTEFNLSLIYIISDIEIIAIPYLILSAILIICNKIYTTYIEIRYS